MIDFSALARLLPSRRMLGRLRIAALGVIVFGPIAQAALDVHHPGWTSFGAREIQASDRSASSSPAVKAAAERVADYQERRNPAIDQLLPEGRGGTRFFERLPGAAGMTQPESAAIALSAADTADEWPESVELHERAHLVDAFLSVEVARLMSHVAAPASGEYANKNPGEHFAEMAARAWQVVAPPGPYCIESSSVDRLRQFETAVPGTAGFVVRFLTSGVMPVPDDDAGELLALAEKLSAPQREEWAAIWRGVDAQRRPDGTFEPWAFHTIRAALDARRTSAATSGGFMGRVISALLWPSAMVVRMAQGPIY